MKNLSFLDKLIFFINNLFALLFIASFALPYISPKSFPLLSLLSLAVPLLIVTHIVFAIYWMVKIKKQFLLSLICLILAVSFSFFPYKFNATTVVSGSSFKVMSYNARIFNRFNWIKSDNVPQEITAFIQKNNPDIIAFQEYYPTKNLVLNYPHKYTKLKGKNSDFGQAIYSKYKIINKGAFNFEDTANNIIFIDILKNKDTIRIYNMHLESIGIKPKSVELGGLDQSKSKKIISRLTSTFTKQQEQVERMILHRNDCSYKVIILGDFNNTAYSWAYHKIKGNLKDSFFEAGQGFGQTYPFNGYPLRIDFILSDPKFNTNAHQNFNLKLSDHEPIIATLSL